MSLIEKISRPIAGITFPTSPLILEALAFVEKHSNLSITYHVVRSAYFALILAKKVPSLKGLSPSTLVLAVVMHDLGWDPTRELVSPDKRFEVDGANAARDFLRAHDSSITEENLQLVWDAIALHTTPSIAQYKQPVVAATTLGVTADFVGPDILGGGVLTVEEWRAVVKVFPLPKDMSRQIRDIFCGLCATKPDTTYDNAAGQFGEKYLEGYNLKGHQEIDLIERGLKKLEEMLE